MYKLKIWNDCKFDTFVLSRYFGPLYCANTKHVNSANVHCKQWQNICKHEMTKFALHECY